MLQKARGKQTETRETSSLIEVKRTLEEAREILRGLEGTALAGVAAQLSTAAESLAETAAVLHKIRPGLWVDREGIRAHLALPYSPYPHAGARWSVMRFHYRLPQEACGASSAESTTVEDRAARAMLARPRSIVPGRVPPHAFLCVTT
jgi:hypothetical protein